MMNGKVSEIYLWYWVSLVFSFINMSHFSIDNVKKASIFRFGWIMVLDLLGFIWMTFRISELGPFGQPKSSDGKNAPVIICCRLHQVSNDRESFIIMKHSIGGHVLLSIILSIQQWNVFLLFLEILGTSTDIVI